MSTSLPVLRPDYQDAALCAACGGACCKRMPGETSPEEWGAPDQDQMRVRLRRALASGDWAVDWWEGDPRREAAGGDEPDYVRGYYVRPSLRRLRGRVTQPAWRGGDCTFLTPAGCGLPHDRRPLGCRMLRPVTPEPGEPHGQACYGNWGKHEAALAWLDYHDLIRELLDEFDC